jgi:hypothetical protein
MLKTIQSIIRTSAGGGAWIKSPPQARAGTQQWESQNRNIIRKLDFRLDYYIY